MIVLMLILNLRVLNGLLCLLSDSRRRFQEEELMRLDGANGIPFD